MVVEGSSTSAGHGRGHREVNWPQFCAKISPLAKVALLVCICTVKSCLQTSKTAPTLPTFAVTHYCKPTAVSDRLTSAHSQRTWRADQTLRSRRLRRRTPGCGASRRQCLRCSQIGLVQSYERQSSTDWTVGISSVRIRVESNPRAVQGEVPRRCRRSG
jgi:hypothetical protein